MESRQWAQISSDEWRRRDDLFRLEYAVRRVGHDWKWSVQRFDGQAIYDGLCDSAEAAMAYVDRYRPNGGLSAGTAVGVVYDVQPSHKLILAAARNLAAQSVSPGDGMYEASVILAQTACEVLTAQVMISVAQAKGLIPSYDTLTIDAELKNKDVLETLAGQLLSDATGRRCLSFNLGNPDTRRMYVELTGDRIGAKPGSGRGKGRRAQPIHPPWWDRLAPLVRLRNDIVHNGEIATKEQASDACDVGQVVTDYLESIRASHPLLHT